MILFLERNPKWYTFKLTVIKLNIVYPGINVVCFQSRRYEVKTKDKNRFFFSISASFKEISASIFKLHYMPLHIEYFEKGFLNVFVWGKIHDSALNKDLNGGMISVKG